MNFFPNGNNMMIPNEYNINNNNIFNIINELNNRIRKLEQRITRLENDINKNDINYNEPDNSLYMI